MTANRETKTTIDHVVTDQQIVIEPYIFHLIGEVTGQRYSLPAFYTQIFSRINLEKFACFLPPFTGGMQKQLNLHAQSKPTL